MEIPEKHQRILELAPFMTMSDVGREVGVTKQRVWQILRSHGVVNPRRTYLQNRIRTLHASGLSNSAIQREIGCGRARLESHMAAMGLRSNMRTAAQRRAHQACELFDQGEDRERIAQRLSVRAETVSRYLHKHGRSYSPIGEERKPRTPSDTIRAMTPAILRDLDAGDSQHVVARRYGITQSVVSRISRERRSEVSQ